MANIVFQRRNVVDEFLALGELLGIATVKCRIDIIDYLRDNAWPALCGLFMSQYACFVSQPRYLAR
jgi:hypothetical protein